MKSQSSIERFCGDDADTRSPEYLAYREGREFYMENSGSDYEQEDNPYIHQPHTVKLADAWKAGFEDEQLWALDSTGR